MTAFIGAFSPILSVIFRTKFETYGKISIFISIFMRLRSTLLKVHIIQVMPREITNHLSVAFLNGSNLNTIFIFIQNAIQLRLQTIDIFSSVLRFSTSWMLNITKRYHLITLSIVNCVGRLCLPLMFGYFPNNNGTHM